MLELFVVGTFWFWALIIAEIVLLFVFIENENGIGATMSIVAFAGLLQWCGNVDIIHYVQNKPLFIVSCAVAYFALGAVWGTIKWWIYCHDRLEDYEDAKASFLKSRGVPDGTKVVPVELRAEWKDKLSRGIYVHDRRYSEDLSLPPQVRQHKAKIMRWMSFWVISMIWSFINDFVKRVYRTIYQKMAGYLQAIGDRMFGNVKADFEVPTDDHN